MVQSCLDVGFTAQHHLPVCSAAPYCCDSGAEYCAVCDLLIEWILDRTLVDRLDYLCCERSWAVGGGRNAVVGRDFVAFGEDTLAEQVEVKLHEPHLLMARRHLDQYLAHAWRGPRMVSKHERRCRW